MYFSPKQVAVVRESQVDCVNQLQESINIRARVMVNNHAIFTRVYLIKKFLRVINIVNHFHSTTLLL